MVKKKGNYPCRLGCGREPLFNPQTRDSHEEACARKNGIEAKSHTEETPMSECKDCIVKDSDINRLTTALDQSGADLEQVTKERDRAASGHPSLAEILQHGKVVGCTDCSQALLDHNQAVISKALAEISPEALRQLAIDRNILPERIKVELPS